MANTGPEEADPPMRLLYPDAAQPLCPHAALISAFIDAMTIVDGDRLVEEELEQCLAGAVDGGEDEDPEGVDPTTGRDWETLEPYITEAQEAWSDEEVDEMMTYLKENGKKQFLAEYRGKRMIPIPILLYAFEIVLCTRMRELPLPVLQYFLDVAIYKELERREKLPMYNTVDDVVELIKRSRNIMMLTGAGISVSCGIPDFRSRNGLYATLQNSGEYLLDDPHQMFEIDFFKQNPAVFYSFASKIYPSNFIPSPCHRFIRLIETKGKLLRNYTQNIDTLETRAGVQRVIQCHGSFATASCVNCKAKFPGNAIEKEIMSQTVPICKTCPPKHPPVKSAKPKKKLKKNASPWEHDSEEEPDIPAYPPGIIKPDITFFGEKLSDEFERALLDDTPRVDLLLVIGTSLKVSPVSEILMALRHSIPQIVINKTPIKHANPDVVLLGNADDIVQYLCRKLGWDLPELPSANGTSNLDAVHTRPRKRLSEEIDLREPKRVGNSHVWLFEGAEGGKWVEELERLSLHEESPGIDVPAPSYDPTPSTGDSQRVKRARTG